MLNALGCEPEDLFPADTRFVDVGDIVAVDPAPEFIDNGFIVSRHLDDKAGVAIMLAALAALQRVKAQTKNVLLLDAGDVFQGTPLFTFFSGEPDYMTMAMAGYDAIAVGNHDMDNGLDNLLKQSVYPP